jgi:hypothetical protein
MRSENNGQEIDARLGDDATRTTCENTIATERSRRPTSDIRVKGDVAYVSLTQGYEAVIDVGDIPLVSPYKWCVLVCKNTIYAVRGTRRGENGYPARNICMHRVIAGTQEGFETDHINGNGLDNRRCNLRNTSRAQNSLNTGVKKNNTSGYKGVDWSKTRKKWRARIRVNGERIGLGYYGSPEEAGAAYNEAAKIYHGEFARDTLRYDHETGRLLLHTIEDFD